MSLWLFKKQLQKRVKAGINIELAVEEEIDDGFVAVQEAAAEENEDGDKDWTIPVHEAVEEEIGDGVMAVQDAVPREPI